MTTQEIHNFGNTYILSDNEIEKFETLTGLFEEEEKHILSLKKEYALEVREDLLILFVQMYLLRFAIPYFQITHNKFPDGSDFTFLKKVLYFCLVGRLIDDLVDADSKMFKTYESILMYQKYYFRLIEILSEREKEKFDNYLLESTKYSSPILETELQFEIISNDVLNRIKYFFCLAELIDTSNSLKFKNDQIAAVSDIRYESKSLLIKKYVGILLGGLDVNDLIADGYKKKSSTVVSNYVYNKFYNEEGKLLLDKTLLSFYDSMKKIFESEAEKLIAHCNTNSLHYTANILKSIQR